MKNKLFFILIFAGFSVFASDSAEDWVYENVKKELEQYGVVAPLNNYKFNDYKFNAYIQIIASCTLLTRWQGFYRQNGFTFPTKGQIEQIKLGYEMAKKKDNNKSSLPEEFEPFWLTQLNVSTSEVQPAEFFENIFLKWSSDENLIPVKPEFTFIYNEINEAIELQIEKKLAK